jgi:hypothetical protein
MKSMIKRKPVRALLGMGVSLGLILACVMSMTSVLASPAVNMTIVPASYNAVVNQIFTVTIQLSGPDSVRGASAYVNFDKTKLQVQSITPGTALDTVLQNEYDNVAGAINYSAGKLTGTMPTGTFTLATIQLKALAVTSTPTPLTFVFEQPNRVTDVITTGSVSVLGTATSGAVSISAPAAPTVAFSAATYSASEGAGSAVITAHLSATSTDTVTVLYSTSAGTATPGSDYTTTSGTLSFSPGQTSKTFSVPILEDTSDEANETVNLALTSPSHATLGTPSTAVLTIVDNDAAGPVGGNAYWPNKLLMLLPWIAIGAAVIAGITLLVRRRRGAAR